MQKLAYIILFVLAIMAQAEDKPCYDLSECSSLFAEFIEKYKKEYKDEADKEVHYQAFCKSLEEINEANARDDSATFDINEFADYTPEQWNRMRGFGYTDK